jgi:hypothetical protein
MEIIDIHRYIRTSNVTKNSGMLYQRSVMTIESKIAGWKRASGVPSRDQCRSPLEWVCSTSWHPPFHDAPKMPHTRHGQCGPRATPRRGPSKEAWLIQQTRGVVERHRGAPWHSSSGRQRNPVPWYSLPASLRCSSHYHSWTRCRGDCDTSH